MNEIHTMLRRARSLFRLLVLLATSLQAGASFFLRRIRRPLNTAARAEWLHHWCQVLLHRLGIEIVSDGRFPARGLLASNHLSYLDILVFSALSPCVFVSKKEVLSWPLYGWLANMAGTVFVDRASSADAHRVSGLMSAVLAEGIVVVLFPEGTSTNGSSVLRFHAALFESAIATREPVAAARIGYSVKEGSVETDVCYWGTMTFLPHVLRFLAQRGVRATVRFGADARTYEERRVAANATHDLVVALGFPGGDPETGRLLRPSGNAASNIRAYPRTDPESSP